MSNRNIRMSCTFFPDNLDFLNLLVIMFVHLFFISIKFSCNCESLFFLLNHYQSIQYTYLITVTSLLEVFKMYIDFLLNSIFEIKINIKTVVRNGTRKCQVI